MCHYGAAERARFPARDGKTSLDKAETLLHRASKQTVREMSHLQRKAVDTDLT